VKREVGYVDIKPNHKKLIESVSGDPNYPHEWKTISEHAGHGTSCTFISRRTIYGIMHEVFFTGQQFHQGEHNIVRYFLSCSDEEEEDEKENEYE
jgi:hypothetical protein